jgi:hypothetical protein
MLRHVCTPQQQRVRGLADQQHAAVLRQSVGAVLAAELVGGVQCDQRMLVAELLLLFGAGYVPTVRHEQHVRGQRADMSVGHVWVLLLLGVTVQPGVDAERLCGHECERRQWDVQLVCWVQRSAQWWWWWWWRQRCMREAVQHADAGVPERHGMQQRGADDWAAAERERVRGTLRGVLHAGVAERRSIADAVCDACGMLLWVPAQLDGDVHVWGRSGVVAVRESGLL